jgi:hypothetical protein
MKLNKPNFFLPLSTYGFNMAKHMLPYYTFNCKEDKLHEMLKVSRKKVVSLTEFLR